MQETTQVGTAPPPPPMWKRRALLWTLVVLGGLLFEIGYFRWWQAILLTPLPFAWAFALCRSRASSLLFGFFGGFVALRIQQNELATYDHVGATLLILLSAATLAPVALAVHEGARRGFRMAWLLPVAWVGAEALRLSGPLGLPFAVLGFACHEQIALVQMADLGGPMLISFAIAAANGVLLDAILARGTARERFRHALLPGGCVVAAAWAGLLLYGQLRIGQIEHALEPGPRIAVVQSDALSFTDAAKSYDGDVLLRDLMRMSEEVAAAPAPPTLIVWPEKAADIPLFNEEFLRAEFDPRMLSPAARDRFETDPAPITAEWARLQQERAAKQTRFLRWVGELGIPVLAGYTHQRIGGGEFPRYFEEHNAATLFVPGAADAMNTVGGEGGDASRPTQFKMRLFPGGEYLPGGGALWLKALGWLPPARRWIESIGNLGAGEERVLMRVDGHPLVVAICSEILRSDSAGVFMQTPEGRQPLIVTMSNEGRFHRNHSLMVSQMAMVFRAVEARTTVARAANAGISGFVDPAGRYHGLVTNRDGKHFTRLGAPDSAAIDAVLAFRREHATEAIASDPALAAELTRLVAEVERLRALAGIQGVSLQDTFTTSARTVYQRGGRYFPHAVLGAFALLLVFFLLRPHRAGAGADV